MARNTYGPPAARGGQRRQDGGRRQDGYSGSGQRRQDGGRRQDGYSGGGQRRQDGGRRQAGYSGGGQRRQDGGRRQTGYSGGGQTGGGRGQAQTDAARRTRAQAYEKAADAAQAALPAQEGGADEAPFLIIGRNAVREAIRAGRSIDRLLVAGEPDGSLRELVSLARDHKLVVREVPRKKLDELCMPFGHGGRTANHQGIVAYAAGMEYCGVEDILACAAQRGEAPFVIVLDGVEDPHNLGSIIRSAECAGAHGVIIGKRRSASVTPAAVKAAAGATALMRVARVVNIPAALAQLKAAGLWIAGADMGGGPMARQPLAGPLALVIGGEGGGLTRLVRQRCDLLVSIPMHGQIGSLNAGVAAAVLMFEKRRQDAAGGRA